MYVCICNAIKEHDLRAQARAQTHDGAHGTAEDLMKSLNGCLKCGLCTEDVECIIEEETGCICEKQKEYDTLANNNIPQHNEFIKVAAE